MAILAFDLGGTAVKYGVWENEGLHSQGQFPTPQDWESMQAQLLATKKELGDDFEGVAISAPGAVDSEKGTINGISAIPYIHHFPIADELSRLFGLPVALENDANCAGIAEIWQGAAKDRSEVLFIVIGTGIGGAVFHNSEMIKGSHLFGGEFGLIFVDDQATFSEVGTAVRMAWRYCDRLGVDRSTYSGKEVFEFAESGQDLVAAEEVENFYAAVTRGLFSIQFTTDPECIVIGGGVSAKAGLIEELNQRMEKLFQHYGLTGFLPEILPCAFRNDANLVGAVATWVKKYHN